MAAQAAPCLTPGESKFRGLVRIVAPTRRLLVVVGCALTIPAAKTLYMIRKPSQRRASSTCAVCNAPLLQPLSGSSQAQPLNATLAAESRSQPFLDGVQPLRAKLEKSTLLRDSVAFICHAAFWHRGFFQKLPQNSRNRTLISRDTA